MSLLTDFFAALNALLGNSAALSIVFGLVISLAGTQYLKFRVPMPKPLRDEYRWFVRLMSLPLGFFPVYFTWPLEDRLWVALSVGLGAPFLYKVVMAAIYWKWPWLEQHVSAKPRHKPSA
ncbi:MAG TPA: hypothetical protein VFS24_06325 [Steroidobacteraceae bacterium]|nr:hypothetical protein [Steroidobacteraceae bacterium]